MKWSVLIVAALVVGVVGQARAQYSYTTLDDPLATNGTEVFGIEGNDIVGRSTLTRRAFTGFSTIGVRTRP